MKSKDISIIFFKHFPLYLLFSVPLVFIVATTIDFKADFTPFNEKTLLYFLSFVTVFLSAYLVFKSYVNIDTTTKTLIVAHAAIMGCIILIAFILLLLFSLFISGEGVGFLALLAALFISAILIFLFLNVIGFIVHKHSSAKGTFIFLGMVGLLTVTGMAIGFYSYANSNSLYQHLVKSKPIQFVYRYNDDIYYVTSEKKGIFRMTRQGETTAISHADIDIKKRWDFNFCIEGDKAYFKDKEGEQKSKLEMIESSNPLEREYLKSRQGWKRISLLDLKIEEVKDHDCSLPNYIHNQEKYIFGEDAEQLKNVSIFNYQVNGDGYVYYSNQKGLFRLKAGIPELLARGDVTVFNIEGTTIYYYDVNKGNQLNSIVLK